MTAEVWYRKWRPRTFTEVSGQEHAVRTLTNAVALGRVAHAYLLCGPRGTGKTTIARLLAKAVNCAAPSAGQPCNVCPSCVAVNENRALDLVEMDAASNRGIDDIRSLRDRVGYHPSAGRYRVYLIDEVHELTAQAFDALLKTLEEPPAHIIFVLATTDAHKVPPTIISRCQRFDLTRVRHADIVTRLEVIAQQEGVRVDPEALSLVARAAGGGLRDAVNLLEQLHASFGAEISGDQARAGLGFAGDDRAQELAICATRGDFAGGLAAIAGAIDDGVEMRQFNRAVTGQLRALLLAAAGADAGLEGLSAEARSDLLRLAGGLEPGRILRALKAFSAVEFRGEIQPALPLELALADVTLLGEAAPLAATGQPGAGSRSITPTRPEVPPAIAPPPVPAVSRPAGPRGLAEGAVAPPPVAAVSPSTPIPEPAIDDSMLRAGDHGQPAAVERPAAVRDSGPLTLTLAQARFREIFELVRAQHRPGGGLLNSGCDIVGIDEQTITFGLRFPFMQDKLAKGTAAYNALCSAVEQVFGAPLEVHCTHMPDVVDRLRASPPRASHLLEEAQRLGGTLVEGGQ